MTRSYLLRGAAFVAAAALALSGCARSTEPTEDPQSTQANGEAFVSPGVYRQNDAGGEPTKGGTLTFAEYAETRSLDPTQTIPTASSGGNSLVAVYDQLWRYNQETGEYEPRLAESVEPNEDFTEWTVTLRPDVKFSDGSDLDADAVLGSVGYYLENQGYDLGVIYPLWDGVEKVDDLTVVFKLKGSWATFDDMLGRGMGFIVAPAAYSGDEFTPIGAGAFTLDDYKPGESMTFTANPNHWDGAPNIETLRWVWLGNDETKVDSFNSGSVNGAYIRKPGLIKQLRDENEPGAITLQNGGNILMMNAVEGRALANPKVRKAVALAIDPTVIYERAHDGLGLPGKSLFSTESKWYSETDTADYDPEEAKNLVEEAKAEGFDGKITYTGLEDPTAREEAMVIMGQLEAAGFEVELNMLRTVADFISAIFIEKNYDLGKAAIQITENDPYYDLYSVYHSQSAANVLSNNDREMDALIDELREASSDDAKVDVIKRIDERYQDVNPTVSLGSSVPMSVWDEDVHGIDVTNEDMLDFSKAWIKN